TEVGAAPMRRPAPWTPRRPVMPDLTVPTTSAPGEPGAADRIGEPGARPSEPADAGRVLALAVEVARGLADVEAFTALPVEAQAAWARRARPVLADLVAALDRIGGAR